MGYICEQINLNNGNYFKISGEMSGKMKCIRSLNTSHILNPFCQENRSNKDSICSHCYSYTSEKRYKLSTELWKLNYKVLSENVLTDNEIPVLKQDILFRFNAHGDLINRVHYNNLIKIAKKNPGVKFALWTKNLKVIYKNNGIIKLDNLQYVYSDMYLNNLGSPIIPDGFDKLFRVYTIKTIRKHEIKINCINTCFKCRICYTQNDIRIVNEQIKSRFK
jgi:hypothetical protein